MQKIVVFSGAGISAESGIRTFRDSGGLWEEYDIMEVASIQGWHKDPALVQDFYNQRRKQLAACQPNPAHYALVKLEQKYRVEIITQNVDDLHDRAGSSNIIHLHGELTKVRSERYEKPVYDIGYGEIKMGDKCEKGHQLRPHIVWFGEAVPLMMTAASLTQNADILIIVGTSLNVYPAASLIEMAPTTISKYWIDPEAQPLKQVQNLIPIREKAGVALPVLVEELLNR
jgi:NAD-dependent deacetylase